MIRPANFIAESFKQRDWLALSMLAIVLTISVLIGSMPFSSTTRELAMKRFQVVSSGFVAWAVWAPVPSMYNFENRAMFSNELLGELPFDENHPSWFSLPINHFPGRVITFGDYTPKCFADQRHGTIEMSSRFGESSLTSRWEIREQSDGTLRVNRIFENWVWHDAIE